MAAAQTLAERGIRVTVFESARVLGGRARRIEMRGEQLDNGQHILSGAYTTLLDLMRRANVPDASFSRIALRLSMPPSFRLQAPRWPAPLHMAGALLRAQGLSWRDRLSAVGLMKTLKKDGFKTGGDETVAGLLERCRQSDAVRRYLWQPLAVGALNTPIEAASAQVFANVLRDALDAHRSASDLILPRVDLSALYPDAAAGVVTAHQGEVLTGRRVTAIRDAGRSVLVTIDGSAVAFSAAIVAVGPHQLESLDGSALLAAVSLNYRAIETVYFKFDNPVRLPEPMLGQPGGHVQWFFDRRALLRPDANDGLIAGVVSAAVPGESPGESAVLEELSRHVPGLPAPAWIKTVTEKFATFSCTPQAQRARPTITTRSRRVFLAGDYLASPYPGTLESAARSGVAASDAAMRTIQLEST